MSANDHGVAARIDPQLNSGVVDEDAVPTENTVGHDGVVRDQETDPDRRDLRAEIGKYVSLAGFPATAKALLDTAIESGAPERVIEELRGLPNAASFETTRDLWLALDLDIPERF